MLPDDELVELMVSIVDNGLRRPIVMFEDAILDGRNRWRACLRANVDPTYIEFTGTWDEALNLVEDENVRHRHLTPSQRAMIATDLARLRRGRPGSENAQNCAITQSAAADRLKVSRRSVQSAATIRDKGTPELADAVKAGTVPVSTAAELVNLSPDEQRAAVAGGKEAVRAAATKARPKVRAPLAPTSPVIHRNVVVDQLVAAVKVVETVAAQLAGGEIVLVDDQPQVLRSACSRLRGGAGWIESILDGAGISDEALAEWLKGGK